MADRRVYRRYAIWFPVVVVVGSNEIWAICRDASSGGFLASAVTPIDVGVRVQARFRVTPDGPERTVTAVVVREAANRDELHLAFPYRVALEFEQPIEALVDELERYADTVQTE